MCWLDKIRTDNILIFEDETLLFSGVKCEDIFFKSNFHRQRVAFQVETKLNIGRDDVNIKTGNIMSFPESESAWQPGAVKWSVF
jgi:hypothetical protein